MLITAGLTGTVSDRIDPETGAQGTGRGDSRRVDMAISAFADDAFEGRVEHADRIGVERASLLNRIGAQSDHERYEADWPSASRAWRDQVTLEREPGRFGRR
jgi:hypothetical protein